MTDINPVLQRNPATGKLESLFNINDYLTVSGSGFGTKNEYVYYDDISSYPLGTITNTIGSMKISINGGVSIANDVLRGGNKAVKKQYYNENDFPKIYLNLPAPSQSAYFACWFRYTNDDFAGAPDWNSSNTYVLGESVTRNSIRYKAKQAVPANIDPATDYSFVYWALQTNVWKLGRIGNTLDDPYHANRYHHEFTGTIPTSQTSALYSLENGYAPYIANNQVSYNPLTLLTKDTWHFYEMWATAGTLNGGDSTFEARINNIPTTRFINGSFKTNSKPEGIQSILTPICGLDNQWQAGKSNTQMWMNGVYTTSCLSRIVMTDTSNYESATNRELQEDLVNGWSDTLIYYKPKRGSFTQGATAYLHVFNNGVLVDTKTVTVP